MKKTALLATFSLYSSLALAQEFPARLNVAQPAPNAQSHGMVITSPDFKPFARFNEKNVNCGGQNVSPALTWKHIPASAKSLAVTIFDPDAPTGSGIWHWAVFNIPVTATGLFEGAGNVDGQLPQGAIQLVNDSGKIGYTGACPPIGDKPHHYIVTLYALSENLPVAEIVSPARLGSHLHKKVIAKTQIIALYNR